MLTKIALSDPLLFILCLFCFLGFIGCIILLFAYRNKNKHYMSIAVIILLLSSCVCKKPMVITGATNTTYRGKMTTCVTGYIPNNNTIQGSNTLVKTKAVRKITKQTTRGNKTQFINCKKIYMHD